MAASGTEIQFVWRHASSLASVLFVALVIAAVSAGRHWVAAIYLLSFWHYYLYGLAYTLGAVALDVFKRDAVGMKSVALAVLAAVYFSVPADWLSLAVVAAGFALNASAARALGPDRTYYGHEVAGLAPLKITAFPYSVIAHPMLVGNIAAFSGMLLNADFRREWWPLACAHVAFNLGLLAMETGVAPRRGCAPAAGWPSMPGMAAATLAGAVAGATAGYAGAGGLLATGLGLCASGYAFVIWKCYSSPRLGANVASGVTAERGL